MKIEDIAIEIAQSAALYFIDSRTPWENTVFTFELGYYNFEGYCVVIKGEKTLFPNQHFSVSIRRTDDFVPVSVVSTRYTTDTNMISLRDAIKCILYSFSDNQHPIQKKRRKYRKGGHILTLDELVKQEFVYWHDKITHNGWFMSWQLRLVAKHIGENGCIFYAVKEEDDA